MKENKVKFFFVEKIILDKLEIFGLKLFEYKKSDVNINLFLMEKKYENLVIKVVELWKDLFVNSIIMYWLIVLGVDERGIIVCVIFKYVILC